MNCQYYRDVLLSQQLLPAIKRVACETFVFQQHSVPAHRARRNTIQLLLRETPDFIGPDLWSPSSRDLKPVDSKIWGVVQQCINVAYVRSTSCSSASLKCGMICSKLSLTQLSASRDSNQWSACVHSEDILSTCYESVTHTDTLTERTYALTKYCLTFIIYSQNNMLLSFFAFCDFPR